MKHNHSIRMIALVLICLLLLPLCTACSSSTALTVGEEPVSYDMLRYFVMNYRNESGHSAEEFAADENLQKELVAFVESRLREIMAYQALAEEYKIDLTKDEQKALKDSVEALKAEYASEEDFLKAMNAAYLTEEVYMELQRLQILAEHLYNYLTNEQGGVISADEATVRADVDAGNFFSAEYLYIYYSQKDKEEKVAFANDLHKRLLAGETMFKLDSQYSATYGLAMEYVMLPVFTYTQQEKDFEEAILALEIGEYTDPIVRGDGILIAHRKEVEPNYVDNNLTKLIDSYKEREFARLVQEKADSMEIVFKSEYKSLKLWKME